MALSLESQKKVKRVIFERAYEIEQKLSEDDFFLAKMAGVRPEQVGEVSLKTAIKELQKEFKKAA